MAAAGLSEKSIRELHRLQELPGDLPPTASNLFPSRAWPKTIRRRIYDTAFPLPEKVLHEHAFLCLPFRSLCSLSATLYPSPSMFSLFLTFGVGSRLSWRLPAVVSSVVLTVKWQLTSLQGSVFFASTSEEEEMRIAEGVQELVDKHTSVLTSINGKLQLLAGEGDVRCAHLTLSFISWRGCLTVPGHRRQLEAPEGLPPCRKGSARRTCLSLDERTGGGRHSR